MEEELKAVSYSNLQCSLSLFDLLNLLTHLLHHLTNQTDTDNELMAIVQLFSCLLWIYAIKGIYKISKHIVEKAFSWPYRKCIK